MTHAPALGSSLRCYLDALEEAGQLVHWREPVRLEPDLRRLAAAAASDRKAGPAVLVERIIGYPNRRIALNVHGSFANLAVLLGEAPGASSRRLFEVLVSRWRSGGGRLPRVAIEDAPVGANCIPAPLNLYALLPLFRVNPYDGGFYIAKACTVSRDPLDPGNQDKQNVGVYRVQVHGPDEISVMSAPSHDLTRHVRAAERSRTRLPIAVMIGNDPFVTLLGATPLRYEESEYEYAAACAGYPIPLATTAGGLDVLAESEIVIEAELRPGRRVPEGPFGEFPGTYTGMTSAPVFKVTRVYARRDAIFENIWLGPGWGELDTLIGLVTSVPIFADLRSEFPEVAAVNALYQHGLTAIISVRNRFGGFAKSVALRALGSAHGLMYLKNLILVDEDVDPFDLERVMWSLSTRTRADDVMVLPATPLVPLDPSALIPGKGHRLVIDATRFVAPDRPGRAQPIAQPSDLEGLQATIRQLQTASRKRAGA